MCETDKETFSSIGSSYGRRVLSKELEHAVARVEEAQTDYHKACEDVWDRLHYLIPYLEEILKIGKRGYKTRMYEE